MKDRASKKWLLAEFVKENELRSSDLEMAYKRFRNLAPSSGGVQATKSVELDFNTWILVSRLAELHINRPVVPAEFCFLESRAPHYLCFHLSSHPTIGARCIVMSDDRVSAVVAQVGCAPQHKAYTSSSAAEAVRPHPHSHPPSASMPLACRIRRPTG